MPAGYVYHVLNRANERAPIFRQREDFEAFLVLLSEAAVRTPMRLCGYCVMPNHWHLVVWPSSDDAVSAYLHWLTTAHAVQCRRNSSSIGHGHVYQGRFRSFPVETSSYYYNVMRYVEANPLRAGLAPRAELWPWSSLQERVRGASRIVPGPLSLPSNWVDTVNAVTEPDELSSLRASARAGRPYGTDDWVQPTAARLGLRQRLRVRGRSGAREPRLAIGVWPAPGLPATSRPAGSPESETDVRKGA